MKKICIGIYQVGMMPTNCYYLYIGEQGQTYTGAPRECIVFDPGDHGAGIGEALQAQGLVVRAVFLTHAHFDHILGVNDLLAETGAELYAYEGEERLCSDADLNLSAAYDRPCTVKPGRYLKDGEKVTAAGITVQVLATPGHTEGSCCYYIEGCGEEETVTAEETAPIGQRTDESGTQHLLIAGDTVFAGSVGRTDFPTGSMSRLQHSIEEKIMPLPDDTLIFPGHGGITDMETEKRSNPYFR